jgi:hypothetical protein
MPRHSDSFCFASGLSSPPKLVPIGYWGGEHFASIDCTTPKGEMGDLPEGTPDQRKRRSMTFAQWMDGWVNGTVALGMRPVNRSTGLRQPEAHRKHRCRNVLELYRILISPGQQSARWLAIQL